MGSKKPLTDFLKETSYFSEASPVHPIIETHFHLDMIKTEESNVVNEFQSLGIKKAITISTSKKNWKKVEELSSTYSCLGFTLGTHPHEADDFDSNEFEKFYANHKSNKKLCAIGEIGLDYFYNLSSPDNQKNCLNYHLDLASREDLPVVIHNRESDSDMIEILKSHSSNMKKKGVIHSFSSGLQLAEFALENDFYLGFNGMCTFKTAENVRDAVRMCPLEKILLETDSPFLTPTPYRGKENTPSYLPLIALKIAEIKNISLEALLKQAYDNSFSCFNNLKNI
jgi:TatD DNase family protein